jgi:hypothetical protein
MLKSAIVGSSMKAAVLVLALSAAPLASKAATVSIPPLSIDLAHWAANGGWGSQWSVVNTSFGPITCTLTFTGSDGLPASLVTSAGTGSSVSFTVTQGGTADIQAGGAAGSVQNGSSSVSCSGPFLADVTYTWMPDGVPLTQASVLPGGAFTNYVFAANAFTGIALQGGGSSATATVSAYDLTGNQVGSATATVPANGKYTANLNQLLTNLPSSFEGSATVTVNNNGAVELVAVNVTPGANGSFVLGNVPVVGFNTQPASFSGTYNFLSGSLTGQRGTFSISSLSPLGGVFGTTTFIAIATIGSITGTVGLIPMNNNQMFLHFSPSSNLPLAGAAAALTQVSATGWSGSIYLQGTTSGSVGTITLQ